MTFGSRFRRQSGTHVRGLSIVVALLVCSFFVSGLRANVLAQDATPATVACAAPEVPPGTPEPMEEEMVASPEADEASPVAEEAAPTPPSGTLVEDQAVIDAATAAVSNVYACLTEGNILGALALTTDNFRESVIGAANLYTAAALAEPWFEGFSETITVVNGVYDNGDGSLSVDYQTIDGKQVYHYLDVLVEEDGVWKFDATFDLTPETDLDKLSIGVNFATADDELVIEIARPEFEATEATLFQVTNTGDWGHNFVLISVPDGFDPASLTHPESPATLPEGTEFLGSIDLEPGQSGAALFEGLEPGSYVIYCYVEAPDGETHADKGMYVPFTVLPPIELDIPDVVGTPAG